MILERGEGRERRGKKEREREREKHIEQPPPTHAPAEIKPSV